MTEALVADLLVIGWGKGGKTLAGKAAEAGRRVVIVERDEGMVGGACINVACIPTKALVHAAETRRPGDDPEAYLAEALAQRDSLVSKLNAVNRAMLDGKDHVTVVIGEARFTGPRTVAVEADGERLEITAAQVVVNTGSAPRPPGVPGGDLPHVHDSTSIQHVGSLPGRLVVVGAGPVGLEFAQMFAGFGSQVTVLSRGRAVGDEDDEVRDSILSALGDAGITVVEGAEVTSVSESEVLTSCGAFDADAVLFATGRVPVVPDGAAAAGIELDDRGFIRVDDRLRTSADGVWAVPTATFVTPPFARVGLTEKAARAQGLDIVVAAKPVAKIAMTAPRDGIWVHLSSTELLNEVLGELTPVR